MEPGSWRRTSWARCSSMAPAARTTRSFIPICTIFNAARTHRDGRYRALHQHPVYAWMKAAGAVYRNTLAWNLRDRLGIRMEQYGKDNEFTRIAGFSLLPEPPGKNRRPCSRTGRSAGVRLLKRPGRWVLRSRATHRGQQRRTRSRGPASRRTTIRRFASRAGVARRRALSNARR